MERVSVADEMPQAGPDGGPHSATAMPRPLGLPWLTVSVVAIGLAAVLFCSVAAVVALLSLVGVSGRDGASDFIQQLKFDQPLQARLGAAVVSAAYVGLAGATLAAAMLRGARGWRDLVAFRRVPRAWTVWRDLLGIAGLTLAYIASSTWAIEHARDRSLLISGQTDVLLVCTIVANLVLLAPIAEELLFRGWIYTALRRRFSFWPSYLVTLVAFAAIHWDPRHVRVVQVLPLAAALGLLRERAGSIKPTIVLHATYNLVIVAIRLAYT